MALLNKEFRRRLALRPPAFQLVMIFTTVDLSREVKKVDYSEKFIALISKLLNRNRDYRNIHSACIAQFILESGRGTSELARDHNNFAGIKWRPELAGLAEKKLIEAPSETAYFCSFASIDDFIEGYWTFLERRPYEGWEAHTSDPYSFIDFIAPKWATDPAYSEKLKDLLGEADALILDESVISEDTESEDAEEAIPGETPCCEGMSDDPSHEDVEALWNKPTVEWVRSPFNWSRGGTKIDTIVVHYTTTRSLSSTVNWFRSPRNTMRTAAHYVIGRDGKIVQMVKDSDACTHGNSQNRRSIGIEHSAAAGDKMTQKQERSSVALIRWLMAEYNIDPERVIPHKCAPRSTRCPGDLFKDYGATGSSNCATTRNAVQAWLVDKVINQAAVA